MIFFLDERDSKKKMDDVVCHAKEIIRLSEQVEEPSCHRTEAEQIMKEWDNIPLPLSDQSVMRNICVRVRPVLRELVCRLNDQQKRLDALEMLVMNMIGEKK